MTGDQSPRPPWPSFRPYIEFVRGVRGDEFADDLQKALLAAWQADWRWETAYARASDLLTDEMARGHDLLFLVRKGLPCDSAADHTEIAEWEEARARHAPRRDGAA